MAMTRELINSDTAQDWLSNLGDNVDRLVPAQRERRIVELALLMESGEFDQRVPDPIVIGKDGVLINGFHRLSALSLANAALWFWVLRDDTITSVHQLPIDRNAPRSDQFLLGETRPLVSIAKVAWRFGTSQRSFPPSVGTLGRIVTAIRDDYQAFNFKEGGQGRLGRSSAFRLVLMVHLHNNTAPFDKLDLAHRSFSSWDPRLIIDMPAVYNFWQQLSRMRLFQETDIAARSYRALHSRSSDLSRVQIKDMSAAMSEFREAVREAYGDHIPEHVSAAPTIMREMKARRRQWEATEVQSLYEMAAIKAPAEVIAKKLGRTAGAVRQKAFSLALSLDSR